MNNNSYIHIFIVNVKANTFDFRPFGAKRAKTRYFVYYIFITSKGVSQRDLIKKEFL